MTNEVAVIGVRMFEISKSIHTREIRERKSLQGEFRERVDVNDDLRSVDCWLKPHTAIEYPPFETMRSTWLVGVEYRLTTKVCGKPRVECFERNNVGEKQ